MGVNPEGVAGMNWIAGGAAGGSGGARGFLSGESTSSIVKAGCGGVTGMLASGAVVLISGFVCCEFLDFCSSDELSEGLLEWSTTKTDVF
jgi:hypothetical protein